MKKVFLVVALVAGVFSLSKAQGGRNMGTPEERAQRSISRLPETLKLTDDQKMKLTTVFLGQSKVQDSLMKAANGDFQSMGPKMAEMRTGTDAKVMALLNDDQKKMYEEYVKTRPAGGARGGQGGGTPPATPNN